MARTREWVSRRETCQCVARRELHDQLDPELGEERDSVGPMDGRGDAGAEVVEHVCGVQWSAGRWCRSSTGTRAGRCGIDASWSRKRFGDRGERWTVREHADVEPLGVTGAGRFDGCGQTTQRAVAAGDDDLVARVDESDVERASSVETRARTSRSWGSGSPITAIMP